MATADTFDEGANDVEVPHVLHLLLKGRLLFPEGRYYQYRRQFTPYSELYFDITKVEILKVSYNFFPNRARGGGSAGASHPKDKSTEANDDDRIEAPHDGEFVPTDISDGPPKLASSEVDLLHFSLHVSTHYAMTIRNPQGFSLFVCQNKVPKMKSIKSIK